MAVRIWKRWKHQEHYTGGIAWFLVINSNFIDTDSNNRLFRFSSLAWGIAISSPIKVPPCFSLSSKARNALVSSISGSAMQHSCNSSRKASSISIMLSHNTTFAFLIGSFHASCGLMPDRRLLRFGPETFLLFFASSSLVSSTITPMPRYSPINRSTIVCLPRIRCQSRLVLLKAQLPLKLQRDEPTQPLAAWKDKMNWNSLPDGIWSNPPEVMQCAAPFLILQQVLP